MTDRFPLLRLPQDVLKNVLRSMEPFDLIMFSFSSNRAKSLVASINLNSDVVAQVSNFFKIIVYVGEQELQFLFYYHEVENGPIPIKIGSPGIVYLTINGEGVGYEVPKVMDIPSWFSHIKTIFNSLKVTHLQFFEDVGNFDLDSIRDSMNQEGFNDDCTLTVSTRNSDDYNRKIMKTFRNIKQLSLETEIYDNGKPPGEVLIQNFSRFLIGTHSIRPTTMKLDDVLMMNSKDVIIDFNELTEKDANRFLRLWMRWNSNTEFFSLSLANEMNVDRDAVLKGIKFKEIPLEEKRFLNGFQEPIEGGIDIVRKDGTKGTITFDNGCMDFYVWHDHQIPLSSIHSRRLLVMTDRFPLLRLPQDALKSVLRSMDFSDLILFSFSSNRTKTLVASINMKSNVTAEVSNILTIIARFGEQQFQFQFYSHEIKNGAIPITMGVPDIVYLIVYGQGEWYEIPKVMDMPSWFSYIKTIFNCPKIVQLQFNEDVGNFDLDSLRDSMIQENIHELVVSTRNSLSDEYNRRIMKTFRNMKYLYLDTEVYENGKPPGEVLIQNFHEFEIGYYSTVPTTMRLDDILMMNSENARIDFSEFTEKDANRFLKLWMRGNSKLEIFHLRFSNAINVDRNAVLKGIEFQEIPLEVKRLFAGRQNPIKGGIDVLRRDGITGSIKFGKRYMKFFVWHNYCKVEK